MSRCYKLLPRQTQLTLHNRAWIWPGVHFISFEFNFSRIWQGLDFGWVCTIRGRSHIALKNAWKTLGALLSPFFQSARAVALRRRLSLLSNHQLRSPLQEGNFVTWPAVRLRHSEKLRCFYLDAARTRLEKTSASHRDCVASIMSAHTARLHLK